MALFLFMSTASAFNRGTTNRVCFDIDPWGWGGSNQASNADTGCNVCVRTTGGARGCERGIENYWSYDCIDVDRDVRKGESLYVQTDCHDALWIDRIALYPEYKPGVSCRHGCQAQDPSVWGANNEHGWCLSKDRNDYKGWNSDSLPQHVPSNSCFTSFKFDNNGRVYGYYGNRIRRRTEAAGMNTTDDMLADLEYEMNDEQNWVELSAPLFSDGSEADAEGDVEIEAEDDFLDLSEEMVAPALP